MPHIYLARFSIIGATTLLMLALTRPALASQSPVPFDPMQSLLSEAASVSTSVAQQPSEEIEKRKKSDPKFKAAYEHYVNGGWDYFDGHAGAAPGEYCAAFYWKGDGMVRLSGPGGDYAGALMTFWGANIPTPDKSQKVKVTLKQSGNAPQIVHAFNYKLPSDAFGSIVFAVPTIEALLDGMEDVASFNLEINGISVAKVEWHGGLAARDRLRKCVSAKK